MRSAFLLVSALTAGLSYGRKYLSGQVQDRKNKAIEDATQTVRKRLRHQADRIVRNSFRSFAVATGIKAGVITALWSLWGLGVFDDQALTVMVSVALALFLVRDAFVTWPNGRLIFSELRKHGWQPRRALGEVIAAQVFEEVLIEAEALPQSQGNRFIIWLAGENETKLHNEIAEAVASVARETSWQDLKPYLISAAEKFGALAGMYSLLVWIVVHH